MIAWVESHQELLVVVALVSMATVIASVVVVPALIVRAPADYFTHARRERSSGRHPVVRAALLFLKNVIGVVLLTGGILMLVLPGQGLLTILVALLVLDFPGKYALERRLVGLASVQRALNWLRRRAGKDPFLLDQA